MHIYSVRADVNQYQMVTPNVSEDQVLEFMTFDCSERIVGWSDDKWFIFNPKIKKGNFFGLEMGGALVFDQRVYDSDLLDLLEASGEILPINLENSDKKLYLLNVLECVNSLDKERTKFHYYEDGAKGRILRYSFHSDRITESSLFKIPETSRSEILSYTGLKEPDDEFKTLYEKLEFTGLLFEELYVS